MSEMSPRAQRIADQIQRELAVLIRLEMNDPRVGMVSITGVDVSNDLTSARVYATVMNSLGDDADVNEEMLGEPGELDKLEIDENINALNKASGFLRTMLAKRLNLRVVPRLRFYFDGSIRRGQRLLNLIDDALKADRQLHSE